MVKTKKDLMSEMAQLKVMLNAKPVTASNVLGVVSPILSDKASFQLEKDQIEASKLKPVAVKLLVLDNECDIVDNPPPPFEKTDPRSCELEVGSMDNKVAFGIVFFNGEMSKSLHGAPLQPGCLNVSVDGSIKPDALLPVSIVGEMEKVEEAVGSHVAWP